MAGLLQNLLWSALDATLLALIVATVARLAKLRAPVRHVLWLMVLLKLLVPPVAVHSFGLSGICTSTVEQVRGFAAQWPRQPLVAVADRVISPDSLAVGQVSQAADVGAEMAGRLEICPTASSLRDEPLSDSLGQSQDASVATLADVPTEAESFQAFEQPSIWQTESPVDASAISPGSFEDFRETSAIDVTPAAPTATGAMALWIWLTRSGLDRGLAWFWLAGSLGLLAVRTRQCAGLLRLVRHAEAAPASVVAACREVAGRFDLARVPAVRIVERSLSPTVCALRRTTILLPSALINRCGNHIVRSVLAHELAHVKRRDHWLCWVELLGSCVYWWHPVFWWARHEMRRAADEAADAWAVSVLGCRQRYAESLLRTVELLVADRAVAATWCPALGQRDTIARRLNMIMKEPLSRRLSWPAWLGVAVVGLLVLPAAPLRSSAQDPPKPPDGVPSDDEIAAAVEAFDATTPQRPREPGVDQPPPRDRRPDGPRPPDAGPRDPQRGQPAGGDRRPDGQRPPESGPRDAQRPQPPGAPGRADGPRDPERRLQELEAKLDRIMQMLEARPGQPGVSATPGGPGRGMGMPGGPGRGMPGGPSGAMPGGPPGGMPGGPSGGMPGARFGAGRPGAGPDGVEEMLRGIELNPEQRERIEHAMKDVQAELQKIDAEQARVIQEFQRRRMELEHRRAEIVRDVLSPEQRERLQQRGPQGERPGQRGSEGRGETRGVGRGDGSGTGRGDGRGEGRDERRVEGRGGPDRPREGTEPRRERGPDQPPDGARGRGGPGSDRPREATEPRGPDRERPREGGEQPPRPPES